MSSINSKVAYLKGLAKGLDIDKNNSEGKLLFEIINVLDDISEEISDLSSSHKSIHEYIDEIDEELNDLFDSIGYDDYESLEDAYNNFEEVKCPNCNEMVYVDKDIISQRDSIICPNCHKKISLLLNNNN
ncbi:CD1247 N-terminal domain-containing protein [Clostridium sp. LBM24168]